MKKSALVTLVLSGALVSGCDDRSGYASPGYAVGADGSGALARACQAESSA